MYTRNELFIRSRHSYFGVCFPSCEAACPVLNKCIHSFTVKTISNVGGCSWFDLIKCYIINNIRICVY